ncbi:MAG TPA: hypothetical protein VMV05_06175 [bacterium]|nr:hypothetical protein [bacterium]
MVKFVEINAKVVNVDQIIRVKKEMGAYLVYLKDGSENSVSQGRYEEIKKTLLALEPE